MAKRSKPTSSQIEPRKIDHVVVSLTVGDRWPDAPGTLTVGDRWPDAPSFADSAKCAIVPSMEIKPRVLPDLHAAIQALLEAELAKGDDDLGRLVNVTASAFAAVADAWIIGHMNGERVPGFDAFGQVAQHVMTERWSALAAKKPRA